MKQLLLHSVLGVLVGMPIIKIRVLSVLTIGTRNFRNHRSFGWVNSDCMSSNFLSFVLNTGQLEICLQPEYNFFLFNSALLL